MVYWDLNPLTAYPDHDGSPKSSLHDDGLERGWSKMLEEVTIGDTSCPLLMPSLFFIVKDSSNSLDKSLIELE